MRMEPRGDQQIALSPKTDRALKLLQSVLPVLVLRRERVVSLEIKLPQKIFVES